MNTSEKLFFNFMPLLRLSILVIAHIYTPYYLGIPLYAVVTWLYYRIISFLFNLIPLTSIDKLFLTNLPNEAYMGITYLEVSKGRQLDTLEFFLNKLVKGLPKLRSVIQFNFGEHWWKPLTYEITLKKLKITYEKDVIIREHKDMTTYSSKILKTHINLHGGDLPYEIIVFTNKESIPLIGFKFHHGLSDGIGFISSFISCSEGYSQDIFPIKVRKPTILENIFINTKMFVFFPYYILKQTYRNLIKLNCGPSSFKYLNHNKNSNNGQTLNHEVEHTPIDGTLFTLSKQRRLQDFIQINKSLNITFNDLMISIITSATNKFYKSQNYNKKNIGIICPVSLRGYPDCFKNTKLENDVTGMSIILPMINDSLSDVKSIKNSLAVAFRDISYIKAGDFAVKFVFEFLPDFINKSLYRLPVRNADFIISNVAGPRKSVYYGDIELVNFHPFLTTGMQASFITIKSYNDTFHVMFNVNEGIQLNPWEFMNFIEAELDHVFNQFQNSNKK